MLRFQWKGFAPYTIFILLYVNVDFIRNIINNKSARNNEGKPGRSTKQIPIVIIFTDFITMGKSVMYSLGFRKNDRVPNKQGQNMCKDNFCNPH